jgi:hypothetical protein
VFLYNGTFSVGFEFTNTTLANALYKRELAAALFYTLVSKIW